MTSLLQYLIFIVVLLIMPRNNQIPVQILAFPAPTDLSQNPHYIHPNENLAIALVNPCSTTRITILG